MITVKKDILDRYFELFYNVSHILQYIQCGGNFMYHHVHIGKAVWEKKTPI